MSVMQAVKIEKRTWIRPASAAPPCCRVVMHLVIFAAFLFFAVVP